MQKKIVLSEFARVHKHYMKEGFLEKLDQDHLITGLPDQGLIKEEMTTNPY